jgi:5-methylcytosine-specific restriction endonuclease McrA
MSKNPHHGVGPSTIQASHAAITALETFLTDYRAGMWLEVETEDNRSKRLIQSRGSNFRRKRARFMIRQEGRCSVCKTPIVDDHVAENVADIDYFVLPSWGGPKHELNMTLVCHDCGMKGKVRENINFTKVVETAKAGLIPYLDEQAALNKR